MKYPISFEAITKDVEYCEEVIKMHDQASTYLKKFEWCKAIKNSTLYLNLGVTLCIFLFEIENLASKEDNFLWMMVGDIPPMYLDVYGSKTTVDVLERYTALAKDWISSIELGESIDDCYPFEAMPTIEMANLLKTRVNLIQNSIIPNIDEISLPPSLLLL